MVIAATLSEFEAAFNELSEANQRYIVAIQQALMFAQQSETTTGQQASHDVYQNPFTDVQANV